MKNTTPTKAELRQCIAELGKLAIKDHFWVDGDNWYSCPKAPEGCSDDQWPKGVCNCGADKHNAKVEAILKLLGTGISAPSISGADK